VPNLSGKDSVQIHFKATRSPYVPSFIKFFNVKPNLTIAFLLTGFVSCTNRVCLHRIETYLNAHTAETKGKYIAESYRSFFMEKKGEGKNKNEALQSFLNWDAPLNPDIHILNYSKNGNTWKVEFNEQNDFSKLIGFPGWKGTEMIRFNSERMIDEMIYIPDDTNPNYKKWLQPAVDWLQKNKPTELTGVYKDGKLIQTSETAKKWVGLLQLWQKETGGSKQEPR
jgi:hypothetical protein